MYSLGSEYFSPHLPNYVEGWGWWGNPRGGAVSEIRQNTNSQKLVLHTVKLEEFQSILVIFCPRAEGFFCTA
jgi:hypothetical protein